MKLKDDDEEEEEEGAASLAHEQRLVTPPWSLDLRVTLTTTVRVAWGLMTFESVWPWFTCSCRLNSQQDNISLLHLQGGGLKKVQFDFKVWEGSTAETARAVACKNYKLVSFAVIFIQRDFLS